MQQMYRSTNLSITPTQVPKASSDCSLPKLINVQGNFAANFAAALSRPPEGYHQHCPQGSQDLGQSYGHHHQHSRALSNGKTQPSGSPRSAGPQGYPKGTPISRLSRSVEELPKDIKDHIQKCRCSCDHMGYGNITRSVILEQDMAHRVLSYGIQISLRDEDNDGSPSIEYST
ncbi:uncharacterized protein [Palaemon carinicauda]|uniref:uncharacterized protein n=1 Tax=Palaemon carinicauda TaxID=392227 RepID=UPI0035B67534